MICTTLSLSRFLPQLFWCRCCACTIWVKQTDCLVRDGQVPQRVPSTEHSECSKTKFKIPFNCGQRCCVHCRTKKYLKSLLCYYLFRGTSSIIGECWSCNSNLLALNRWREFLELSDVSNCHYMYFTQGRSEFAKSLKHLKDVNPSCCTVNSETQ